MKTLIQTSNSSKKSKSKSKPSVDSSKELISIAQSNVDEVLHLFDFPEFCLSTDAFDYGYCYGSWNISAIFADRLQFRFCSLTSRLLSLVSWHPHFLLCIDSICKNLVHQQIWIYLNLSKRQTTC